VTLSSFHWAALNWLDLVLIAILAFFSFNGIRRGFVRDIVGLASALAALVVGMWFYGSAGAVLLPYTSSARIANLLGFGLIVIAVLLCGSLVGHILHRFLRTVGLSFFDRVLGAGLGFVKGLLVAITVVTALMAFGPENGPGVLHSQIAPHVLEASRLTVAIAPMELKSAFLKQYDSVKSALTSRPETK
jgi:membrane protein required for colicin V production